MKTRSSTGCQRLEATIIMINHDRKCRWGLGGKDAGRKGKVGKGQLTVRSTCTEYVRRYCRVCAARTPYTTYSMYSTCTVHVQHVCPVCMYSTGTVRMGIVLSLNNASVTVLVSSSSGNQTVRRVRSTEFQGRSTGREHRHWVPLLAA